MKKKLGNLTAFVPSLYSSIALYLLCLGLSFLQLHLLSSLDQHLKGKVPISPDVVERDNASFMCAREEQQ